MPLVIAKEEIENHMKKSANFLLRQQSEFERQAYAYGVQPVVCTLLGEMVYQHFRECWQNGLRLGWDQAMDRIKPANSNS
jgi:hypothetical protein